jgi:hypothetical protein
LEDFRKIYPEYDVSKLEDAVVIKWIFYSPNIENFDEFAECVSQMKQTLSGVSMWESMKSVVSLYYSSKLGLEIRALIGKFNNKEHPSTLQTRLSHLAQHVVHCGPEHQAWLNRAINNFIAMLGQGVSADAFNYEWQRGPEELGFKKENITTYRARITNLYVHIGSKHYEDLKGPNHSNPRVVVGTNAGEVLYEDKKSPAAWTDRQMFTVPINKVVYFSKEKGDKIFIYLRDDTGELWAADEVACIVPLGADGYVTDDKNRCSFRLNYTVE